MNDPMQLMINSFLSGLGSAAGNFVVLKLLFEKLAARQNGSPKGKVKSK